MHDAMHDTDNLAATLALPQRNETETQQAKREATLRAYEAWKSSILDGQDVTMAYLRCSVDTPLIGQHPKIRRSVERMMHLIGVFDRDDQRYAIHAAYDARGV